MVYLRRKYTTTPTIIFADKLEYAGWKKVIKDIKVTITIDGEDVPVESLDAGIKNRITDLKVKIKTGTNVWQD